MHRPRVVADRDRRATGERGDLGKARLVAQIDRVRAGGGDRRDLGALGRRADQRRRDPAPRQTANTLGRPPYAKQEPRKFDRGTDLHTQSNPLPMTHRPAVLVKLLTSN